MKTNPSDQPDPQLSDALKQWNIQASLPPRFEERVWHRIGLAETAPKESSGVLAWLLRAQTFLVRPGLAAGYITALLLLGFAAGWTRGQEKSARIDHDLSTRYVQGMDPYRMVHNP